MPHEMAEAFQFAEARDKFLRDKRGPNAGQRQREPLQLQRPIFALTQYFVAETALGQQYDVHPAPQTF